MSESIFPLGRHSKQDVESALNNAIDQRFQWVGTAVGATFLKDYYGGNFVVGTNSGTIQEKWVAFQNAIPNIVYAEAHFVGYTATSTPTGITGLAMPTFSVNPAVTVNVAGISNNGFTARVTSANDKFNNGIELKNSAYVFNWHVIAKVR